MPVVEGYEVFTLQSEPEVQALSQQLWSRHVGHHWRHVDNGITLYVLQPHHVKVALALREAIDTGVTLPPPAPRFNAPMLLNVLARAPVTLLTLVTSTVIFLAIHLEGYWGLLAELSYYPVIVNERGLTFLPRNGEWYRVIAPALLHFSWMHLIFNSLWVWEFGRRIEVAFGSITTLVCYLAIAAISNVAQGELAAPGLFGGLSGLVYGLLALVWIGGKVRPAWCVGVSNPILYFMLGWLVLGMIGVVDQLGFGSIANHAHVGGLLAGILIAGLIWIKQSAGRSSS